MRVGATKRSILDWESDRHVPSGAMLDRLLDVLRSPEPERAGLLARFAPIYARTRLAHEPLGAPIHCGQILRAMRLRREWTQTELARGLGMTQGALAKWESGLTDPAEDAIKRMLDLLLATPEERTALTATSNFPLGKEDVTDYDARIERARHAVPFALRDVVLLGLEAELWWRALADGTGESRLCRTIGARAQIALMRGAFDEVDELTRRAIRLAQRSGAYEDGAAAVYAHCWVAQRRPGGAPRAVRLLGRWAELVWKEEHRDWLQAARGLAMVRAGDVDEGLAVLEELDRSAQRGDRSSQIYHRIDLVDGLLLAGRPERAYDLLSSLGDTEAPAAIARTHLALGMAPSAGTMIAVRQRAGEDWMKRDEMLQIERGLQAVQNGRHAEIL